MSVRLDTEDQIVAAIRRIMRAVELHSRRLVEQVGLTGPQLAVLRAAAHSGPTPVGAIARAVHLSQPTVTGILDRLERRGFLQRMRAQHDRRAVNISVTDEGRALLERAPSLLQDQFRTKLDRLHDWEQSLMLSILQRIAAMMEAGDLDAAPHLIAGTVDSGQDAGVPARSEGAP